jgi:uncharacterized membrane protein HdeD (DUF308 family)
MSKMKRIGYIISGLLMILFGLFLFLFPEFGMDAITIILAVTMLFNGIKLLVHYSALARHMVGGKYILYLGIVVLDLGIMTISMSGSRSKPVFIYLFVLFIFTGVLDVLKAFEEKNNKAPLWWVRLLVGLFSVTLGILAVISCFFLKSPEGMTYLFCFALVYSGAVRFFKAFRKTAVVYIQ